MLIAEDLLLLLTDDQTGKLLAPSARVDVALGGALLIELALMGRVDVAKRAAPVREGRLLVNDRSPTSDRLLDEALTVLAAGEGKKPNDVVRRQRPTPSTSRRYASSLPKRSGAAASTTHAPVRSSRCSTR